VTSWRARLAALALAGIAMLAVSACGSGGSEEHGEGEEVDVWVKDFRIKAPKHVPAGDVTFEMYQEGPDHHELIVVRDNGRKLPLRGDDLTVDEDELGPAVVAAIEPEPTGEHLVSAKLKRGHYWLICNLAGHYMGGMRTRVEAG
jgi:uncharacterized cupredoxin-like copper-binding protein